MKAKAPAAPAATTPPEATTTPPEAATTPPEAATTPPEAATTPPEADNLAADLADLVAEATVIDKTPTAATVQVQAQQAAVADQVAGEWVGLVVMLGTPAAAIFAPNWNIQQAELAALGQAWAPIFMEYFPEGPGGMGPWMGAALTTAALAAPRMGLPRHAPAATEGKPEGAASE